MDPSAIDALAIARLQLEALYTFCYLQQDPAKCSLVPEPAWKKNIRFLLHQEEQANLPRFQTYFVSKAAPYLNGSQPFERNLQRGISLCDFEVKSFHSTSILQ